ncbi:MAG: MFS transporter [Gammaproteobacteria bacterium]|nr:MFS transporter [Gammaproteobacteria bacterium]
MPLNRKNLLATRNGRFTAFSLLYISEGIPYGFTSVAMVAFMRQQGVSLELIGAFMAALFLPWAFKWAWAPLIDLIKLHKLGGRRAWIIFCTTMMIATLVVTALVDFKTNFSLLMAMIVLNNLFCATQDVAIDSLAVSTLKENERGRGNGFMFAGQYIGIALGGGAAVFVYGLFGFEVALAYISGLLLLNLLFVLLFVYDPEANPLAERQTDVLKNLVASMTAFVVEVYQSFWKSGTGPMVGVLFALLPVGAMALAFATLGTLQVDYGLTENRIAELRVYNTIAAALGCVVGGLMGDRFGAKRTVALAYGLTAVPTALLGMQITQLGLQAVPMDTFYGLIIAHGVFYGMAYGVRNAIFMGMTNPAVAATQFTAFMGMSNLAISIGNYWQGVVAERFDYATVLYFDAAIAVLVILVIPFLRKREAPVVPPTVEPVPAKS